jgi:hypothetical protein
VASRSPCLFRFSVVAEATNPRLTPAQRGLVVRSLAAASFEDHDGVPRSFSRATLDRWVAAYRSNRRPCRPRAGTPVGCRQAQGPGRLAGRGGAFFWPAKILKNRLPAGIIFSFRLRWKKGGGIRTLRWIRTERGIRWRRPFIGVHTSRFPSMDFLREQPRPGSGAGRTGGTWPSPQPTRSFYKARIGLWQ